MAKAKNEIDCLLKDANKVNNRLTFLISAVHHLKTRTDTNEDMKI